MCGVVVLYSLHSFIQTAATGYQAQPTAASLTPVQQHVVQQYIHQKQGSGPANYNNNKKRLYTPPQNPQTYYCEVCKISCASALVWWIER